MATAVQFPNLVCYVEAYSDLHSYRNTTAELLKHQSYYRPKMGGRRPGRNGNEWKMVSLCVCICNFWNF